MLTIKNRALERLQLYRPGLRIANNPISPLSNSNHSYSTMQSSQRAAIITIMYQCFPSPEILNKTSKFHAKYLKTIKSLYYIISSNKFHYTNTVSPQLWATMQRVRRNGLIGFQRIDRWTSFKLFAHRLHSYWQLSAACYLRHPFRSSIHVQLNNFFPSIHFSHSKHTPFNTSHEICLAVSIVSYEPSYECKSLHFMNE